MEDLLKRLQHVTSFDERPVCDVDCMCGGQCSKTSTDIERLWNTYADKSSNAIKRLSEALSYYEERGWIQVHCDIPIFMDLTSRRMYRLGDDGNRIYT